MVKRYPIPDSYIQEIFQTYHRLPLFKRIPAMARDIANDLNFFYQHQVTATERNEIRKKIEKMFKTTNLRNLYKEFYQWLGRPDLLKQAKGSVYEYPDVFPLVYLKMKLEGARAREGVKHLIVDEMQDYTPLQYNVLLRLFPCKKTILGDRYQSVNPYSSSDAGLIQEVFPGARVVKMNKSYRSTFEITEFARKIHANPELEAMERHGPSPTVKKCKDQEEEREEIRKKLKAFSQSPYKTLGIICKTQQQAEELHQELKGLPFQVHHLDSQSVAFVTGIVITSAHMAKGLEFDQVIVPGADSKNYKTETDQQMLYVACTRAMHVLNITCTGQCTGFLG
jgi:DNA helicase-2/ATP-dependent DNA helicase PcrA